MTRYKVSESELIAKEAGMDLTTSLNLFVALNDAGNAMRADQSGMQVLGTITEVPLAATVPYGPATIQFGGIAKVVLGGTVRPGMKVMTDANGKAVAHTAGLNVAGTCIEGGVANEVGSVKLGS